MNPEFSAPTPPIPDPSGAPAASVAHANWGERPRIARWRWWAHLIVIGSYPILAALSSTIRRAPGQEARLPSSIFGLVLLGLITVAIVLFLLGIAWLFSRATKDELWLRWKGGIGPIWQGALYSLGLRVVAALPFIIAGIVLTMLGVNPKVMTTWIQSHKPQTEGLGDSVRAGSTLYKAVVLSFFSFIVAGFTEELWRAGTMRGLLEVAPRGWSSATKNTLAVVLSALIFGFGHLYQGLLGVGITAVIGIALGAITLSYRSVWFSVIAHGFFDATTFLMVIVGVDKLAPK